MRKKHVKNIFIGHLNINSLRNKFESIEFVIKDNFDIFLISETKLDASFPNAQFGIPGYKSFRKDRNINGGGLIFYVNQDLPCKLVANYKFPDNLEILLLEVNLNHSKFLIVGAYKPPSYSNDLFLNELHNALSFYSALYDDFVLIGDFNIPLGNKALNDLCDSFSLKHLITEATCFKGVNPSCIDHIITNKQFRFMKSCALETGISDHHKMIMSVFRCTFAKGNHKMFFYRDFQSFDKENFENDISSKISNNCSFEKFLKIFHDTLNHHAPLKKKKMRYNNQKFMNKALRKAIMTRSRLRNAFNLKRNNINWKKYKTQRNFCVKLLKQNKKNYFQNINIKDTKDNKKFWKAVAPNFSNKTKTVDTIVLTENNTILRNEQLVANTFNDYFTDLTQELILKEPKTIKEESTLSNILDSFNDSPSVDKIKQKHNNDVFSFSCFSEVDVVRTIKNLPNNKASVFGDIPVQILKQSIEKFAFTITKSFNDCLRIDTFPDILKLADISPVYKKGDITNKENYRPISTLSNLSKVLERLMYDQIDSYMENKLSKLLTGFRKNHSTQHALLRTIETWKTHLNKGDKIGAIFMDLSKAFDTIDHNMLLAKLSAYGFCARSLKFIRSYLTNRYQRCKIGSSYSNWRRIKCGVPQGSILGPLLFNIFFNDIFLFVERSTICNYADDNTLFSCEVTFESVLENLRFDFSVLKQWYFDNFLVLNPDKCYFMTLGTGKETHDFEFENVIVKYKKEEKILGVIIDNELNFQSHIDSICKKSNQKLNALFRISSFMTKEKLDLLVNSFIRSQFSYCPLIWMFCNRTSMNKINKIQERCLRLTLNDYTTNFNELLVFTNEISTHQRCINFLMIEVYKFLNGLSPDIMNEVFSLQRFAYNLRSYNVFQCDIPRSNRYGLNSISYRANQLWSLLPELIKSSPSLSLFKSRIKSWRCTNCPCTLCRTFIQNLGYL